MLGLISLAARLALTHALRRIAQASALCAAAVVFAIIALIGFAAALWIWLAHLLGPIGAALLVGRGRNASARLSKLVGGVSQLLVLAARRR